MEGRKIEGPIREGESAMTDLSGRRERKNLEKSES